MRIRKSSLNSISLSSNSSPSCTSASSPPSSISSSSSITTTNSLASSTDSSSSFSPCSSSLSTNLATKCQGLDLLVKAIHLVTAGSVVGVPYIQRRVVRRRRRALELDRLVISQLVVQERGRKQMKTKARSMVKGQKKAMALPNKYQDSVLHPLKPKSRRQRSVQIGDEMGS